MSEPALSLRDVAFRWPGAPRDALSGICLDCLPGEVLGLVGPNGAGKSTLLRLSAGLRTPSSGAVLACGLDPARAARRQVARSVAFVPADLHVGFPLTVRDFVALGRTPHLAGLFETRADRDAVRDALDAVHASDLAPRPFDQLSAGEQRRVLVARALAQQPRVLLLDEPTANLDVAQGVRLLDLLTARARRDGVAVVAAIHDLNLALLFCDRIVLLDRGRLVAVGDPEAVLTYPLLRQVFGCDLYVGRNELNGRLYVVPMGGGRAGT